MPRLSSLLRKKFLVGKKLSPAFLRTTSASVGWQAQRHKQPAAFPGDKQRVEAPGMTKHQMVGQGKLEAGCQHVTTPGTEPCWGPREDLEDLRFNITFQFLLYSLLIFACFLLSVIWLKDQGFHKETLKLWYRRKLIFFFFKCWRLYIWYLYECFSNSLEGMTIIF